jgi:hypothetical protein
MAARRWVTHGGRDREPTERRSRLLTLQVRSADKQHTRVLVEVSSSLSGEQVVSFDADRNKPIDELDRAIYRELRSKGLETGTEVVLHLLDGRKLRELPTHLKTGALLPGQRYARPPRQADSTYQGLCCKHWWAGYCARGESCTFYHVPSSIPTAANGVVP